MNQKYLEMLQDGEYGPTTARQAEALGIVERNTARLRGMIEQLLELSRIEASEVSLDLATVDLAEVARTVVQNLQPQAVAGQVSLHAELPQLPAVSADHAQLERALTNVVGNAVKFTPPGGRVTVSLTAGRAEQVVTVRDSGMGIPAADLADVGRRFFRASNVTAQTIPGTGLGLAIVAAILQAHHGELQLDSREGEGTEVTLRLPA